jgi:hypothetical protein
MPFFNDLAMGWNATPADPYTRAQLPGALAGTTGSIGGGPLAGGPLAGGWQQRALQFLDPQVALPIAAQLMGAGNFSDHLAGAFQAAGQAIPDMRKRAAVNAYLKSQSGLNLTPEEQQLLASDPELASSIATAHLLPHPKQFIPLPTGEIGIGDPIAGTVTSAGMIGGGGGGGNGQPPGFIFPTAKNYTDPSTGETGLVDQNGLKWVIGRPTPTSDQAQASGAAALAHKANDLIKANQTDQGGKVAAAERLVAGVPLVGPVVTSAATRAFETGKKQFLQAVRALAIQAKINPDSATQGYTEDALFPTQGDTPEDIKQKDGIREQIITNLEQRAGSFVQQPTVPAGGAGEIPKVKSDADFNALPSGKKTVFIDPEGNRRVKP